MTSSLLKRLLKRDKGQAVRVLVVGPDGTGKSSITEQLLAALGPVSPRMRHLHFRPDRAVDASAPVLSPHATTVRNLGQYPAVIKRALLYRTATRAGALRRSDADLILQERGWLDQVVDPIRYRLGPSGAWLAARMTRWVIQYDGAILLTGSSEAISARKCELEPNEIKRQLAKWNSVLAGAIPNFIAIDTVNNDLEQSVAAASDYCARLKEARFTGQPRTVLAWPRRLEAHATHGSGRALKTLYSPAKSIGRARRHVTVRSLVAQEKRSELPSRVARVLIRLGLPVDGIAFIRSSGRHRAVIAIELDGRISMYIKVSWEGRGTLSGEAATLRRLASSTSFAVPTVSEHLHVDDMEVLALLPMSRQRDVPTLDQVVDALIELRWANAGEGVTHGDFRPWNLVNGDPITIFDWEFASSPVDPGRDLIDYISSLNPRTVDASVVGCAVERYARECDVDKSLLLDKAARLRTIGA